MERNFSGYMIENSFYLITDKQPYATERKAALTVWNCVFAYANTYPGIACRFGQLRYYFIQRVFDNA